MSVSLIGNNGTSIATQSNPIPVTFPNDSLAFPQHVMFSHLDTTMDSFERLRVSEPRVSFAYSMVNGLRAEYWDSAAYGAGTVSPAAIAVGGAAPTLNNDWCLNLNTTTATTTGYWMQSLYHVRYVPGISVLFRATFNATVLQANQVIRVGMFTDQGTFPSNAGDGVFLELNGTTPRFGYRTLTGGGVGAAVVTDQTAWSLDPLNGTGTSGVTLDFTKTQHLVIEYQWLGVGTIRFGFETGSKGVVWAHEVNSVNNLAVPWSRTGSLPVRAEIYTTGVVSQAGLLKLINCTVLTEGDIVQRATWRYRSANSGTTVKAMAATAATGSYYPLVAIRNSVVNDATKRSVIIPTRINIVVQAAATGPTALEWALIYAPTTLTSATFAALATEGAQVDTAAASGTAIAGGIVVTRGVFPNVVNTVIDRDLNADRDNLIKIAQNAAGSLTTTGAGVYVLCVSPLGAAATAGGGFFAAIEWKEDI